MVLQGMTYSTYLYQVRGHVFHFGRHHKKHDAQPMDDQGDVELPLLRGEQDHSQLHFDI
jgi:hypothetical protein